MNTQPHDDRPRAIPVAPIRSPRVLLAEDDYELRFLLAASLRADGHEVVEAADGGRLLVLVGRTYLSGDPRAAYDAVVTDMRMPVSDGLAILDGLRQAGWRTPAILMTAFGDASTRARVLALGAVLFSKPFDVDDLRTAVLHLVRTGKGPR